MLTVSPHTDRASGTIPDAGQTPLDGVELGAVCMPNINLHERRKRLFAGVAQFIISLAMLAGLVAAGVSRWWRLPLGLMFAGAASGFFQWQENT